MTIKSMNNNIADSSLQGVNYDPNNISSGTPESVREDRLQDQGTETRSKVSAGKPAPPPAFSNEISGDLPFLGDNLMKAIAEEDNLFKAWDQQLAKDGSLTFAKDGVPIPKGYRGKKAAGIDGKPVIRAFQQFSRNPSAIASKLMNGSYYPSAVKRVDIPKGPGKTRPLGIPVADDRTVQTAVLRKVEREIDPYFLDQSHGFRPSRSVFTAAEQVLQHIKSGKSHVANVDLKGFFDTVDHDLLMEQLGSITSDPVLLKLIWRFLKAGVMINGELQSTDAGLPQGGPMSPFLANIFLHRFDTELMRRDWPFVRYADDFLVFAPSYRAGNRIMRTITEILEGMRLIVNQEKSSVIPVTDLEYLGFDFRKGTIRISQDSIADFKQKVRAYCKRGSNKAVEKNMAKFTMFINGWLAHYGHVRACDQCRDIHTWLTNYLTRVTSAYHGIGEDPMLKAFAIWQKAYRCKNWWRAAIDSIPSPLHVKRKVSVSTSDHPQAAL